MSPLRFRFSKKTRFLNQNCLFRNEGHDISPLNGDKNRMVEDVNKVEET